MSERRDVDALFKLPLGEFTAARNALSAQLAKAGQQQEADDVKALTKPSVSAWAVNQLYWRHRKLFDRLLETGERVRRAQLAGASTREPNDARRATVAELTGIAEASLRDGNYGATRDILRRVTTSLEALASFHGLPNAPVAGRLVNDVEPPGFDAVAGLLAPAAAAKPLCRPKAIEAQCARLERQLGRATQDAAEADERARKAAASASAAATAADGAERALELARRDVQLNRA